MTDDPILVLVIWLDSYGVSSEWQEITEIVAPPLTVSSVGWLLHDGEDCIVIVPHLSQADHKHAKQQGCGDMTIPKVAVVSITELDKRDD